MNAAAEVFESHRSRLLGVACRMLGSRADAEDLVQDAYLRWHHSPKDEIQSPVAWLVTTTTRLCLDRLRNLKQERLEDIASWPSDATFEAAMVSPEDQREFAEEVAAAFAAVLERLGREERMAFLLHDVFDYDYPEMAHMLGKSEPACRQLIRRARVRLRESAPRFSVSTESRERILKKLLAAMKSGDRKDVMALLAEGVEGSPARKRDPVLKDPNGPAASVEVEVDVDFDVDADATWRSALSRWTEPTAGGAKCHNSRAHAVL
jgi:RNA polymerase sigma-70 factor, ECF subfamily